MREKFAEPVVFVATGKPPKVGEHFVYRDDGNEDMEQRRAVDSFCFDGVDGYRRLPPGWLAEAVERLRQLDWARFREEGDMLLAGPNDVEIVAALFPPPEPEPEPWIQEAATTWFRIPAERRDAAELARHIAKHAAKGVS